MQRNSCICIRMWQQLPNQILKPGGAFVVYANQLYLPQLISDILDTGLTWWWAIAIKYVHRGTKPVYGRNIFYRWKPLLYFIKGVKQAEGVQFMSDLIDKKIPLNKELHDWAQDPTEAEHVISKITLENQIVLDPMMGSGTTGIAALKLKRKFIGIELNPKTFKIAKANLEWALRNN